MVSPQFDIFGFPPYDQLRRPQGAINGAKKSEKVKSRKNGGFLGKKLLHKVLLFLNFTSDGLQVLSAASRPHSKNVFSS